MKQAESIKELLNLIYKLWQCIGLNPIKDKTIKNRHSSLKFLFLATSYMTCYILYFKILGLKNNFLSISAFFQMSLAYIESIGTIYILQLNRKNIAILMNNFNKIHNLVTNKSKIQFSKNFEFNKKLFALFFTVTIIKVASVCLDIYKNLNRLKILMYLFIYNYAVFLNVLTSILLMCIATVTTYFFKHYKESILSDNLNLKTITELYSHLYYVYTENNNTLQHFYALKIFTDFFELAGELYFGMFMIIIKNLSIYEKIVSIFVSIFSIATKMIATVYVIAQNSIINKEVSTLLTMLFFGHIILFILDN